MHPEVSFAADGRRQRRSRPTDRGRGRVAAGAARRGLEPPSYAPGEGYAADDLLDACAAAWTAAALRRRVRRDSLPDPPETFSDALPAAIWV